MNEMTVKYYAAALCGLIAIFVITHWGRLFVVKRLVPALSPMTTLSR